MDAARATAVAAPRRDERVECLGVGASERMKPLGLRRVQRAEDTKLCRRRWGVDALHPRLRPFAGCRQERVHVLAGIARHNADMDASNDRMDAQRSRIVGMTGLLLGRRSSVAQPMNEES